VRVAEGVPAWGYEVDERVLPNEAALESALSWSKGCYPGQEPVVMARHRGHPPHRLVRLAVDAPTPPPPDAPLVRDGRPVGRVTTAVRTREGVRALGYVRHALVREGDAFAVGDGATARILSASV
jgi:folate-binding protein YgfZ